MYLQSDKSFLLCIDDTDGGPFLSFPVDDVGKGHIPLCQHHRLGGDNQLGFHPTETAGSEYKLIHPFLHPERNQRIGKVVMVALVRHAIDERTGIPARFEQGNLRFIRFIFRKDIGTA